MTSKPENRFEDAINGNVLPRRLGTRATNRVDPVEEDWHSDVELFDDELVSESPDAGSRRKRGSRSENEPDSEPAPELEDFVFVEGDDDGDVGVTPVERAKKRGKRKKSFTGTRKKDLDKLIVDSDVRAPELSARDGTIRINLSKYILIKVTPERIAELGGAVDGKGNAVGVNHYECRLHRAN
jgi:hypothetical protein